MGWKYDHLYVIINSSDEVNMKTKSKSKKKTKPKSKKPVKKKTTKAKKTKKSRSSKSKGNKGKAEKIITFSKNIKMSRKSLVIVIICSVIVIAMIAAFAAVCHNKSDKHELNNFEKDVVWGIDVSYHNGNIDWNKVKEKADFAFIRAGYRGYSDGNIYQDKKAVDNLKGANNAKIPVGVYFYSQATTELEAEQEAEFAVDVAKKYKIDLPVVIDFEYAFADGKSTGRLYNANLDKKENTALVNSFCKVVKKAGYTPAVYASTYIYERHFDVKKLDKDIYIWVADYNKNITYNGDYDIWQYSEKGRLDGIGSKYVDTNYWYSR